MCPSYNLVQLAWLFTVCSLCRLLLLRLSSRILFSGICTNIFGTIIDQAPFAIDDLMKELKAAQASDSDSGQASEEEDEDELREKTTRKPAGKKKTVKQINGTC